METDRNLTATLFLQWRMDWTGHLTLVSARHVQPLLNSNFNKLGVFWSIILWVNCASALCKSAHSRHQFTTWLRIAPATATISRLDTRSGQSWPYWKSRRACSESWTFIFWALTWFSCNVRVAVSNLTHIWDKTADRITSNVQMSSGPWAVGCDYVFQNPHKLR